MKKNVKTFDEFIGEGIVSSIKTSFRMTKINAYVFERSAEEMEKHPDKYKKASDTLNVIKNDVEKKYNEVLKGIDDVIPFNKWWAMFSDKFKNLEKSEVNEKLDITPVTKTRLASIRPSKNKLEVTELLTQYDSANSFYGKATVADDGVSKTLFSYNVKIATVEDAGTPAEMLTIYGNPNEKMSLTTSRHLKEFIRQFTNYIWFDSSWSLSKNLKKATQSGHLRYMPRY